MLVKDAPSETNNKFLQFQHGDFEPMLDRLTVRNMSFAREVDGTTPLMAACARGNHMVVQLLMDLRERTLSPLH
jgi:hypothetical protein